MVSIFREGEPSVLCDIAPVKLTDDIQAQGGKEVGVKRRLTLPEAQRGTKPQHTAADRWKAGCRTFGPYLFTSKLLRKTAP